MKLSIIVVNYNTGPLTKALIESLLEDPSTGALGKQSPKTEIIVVDNNSADDSVSFLRADFPEITVIENKENVGLAGGVNIGLRAAKGQYKLILNPDMIVLPGSIAHLVQFMDKNPDVGMAGGKLISPNGKLQYSCYRYYRPMTIVYRRTPLGKTKAGKAETARFLMKDYDHTTTRDVDWLMGACLIVREEAVGDINLFLQPVDISDIPQRQPVGGMDEKYFLYFEDVDWCRRMWEAGWRVVYVPEAVFSHFHQRSSEGSPLWGILTNRATREHIKSAFKYFWKFRRRPLPHS